MSSTLDALTFPLHGSRLIEASAGTGKTYTIAALYLRLILGHGHADSAYERPLLPSEILVMTFTRAATRELSERIRARLLEAARCFRGEQSATDPLLEGLLDSHADKTEREQAAWRLAMAAEAMDEAAIYTIDAWCQRTLREYAFLSGVSFDEELTADESELLLEATRDYWRQHGYPLANDQLDLVQTVWPNLDVLYNDVRNLLPHADTSTAELQITLGQLLEQLQHQRHTLLAPLSQGWQACARAYRQWLDEEITDRREHWNARTLQHSTYNELLQQLEAWEANPAWPQFQPDDEAFGKLSPAGLQARRRKNSPPLEMPPEALALEALHTALQNVWTEMEAPAIRLRQHAVQHVAQRLAELKQHARSFSFTDLQRRLDQALHGPHGAELRQCLREQYPVALVDEFQDTSPLQYRLFDSIYRTGANDRSSALLLIGDPKQSIYRFRGADINSYLQARAATQGRHYVLDTNYRSTREVVDAVNHWFSSAEDREEGAGAFGYRQDKDNPLPFIPVKARGREERLYEGTDYLPALTVQYDLELRSSDERLDFDAQRCAERIVTWLNNPQVAFARPDDPHTPPQRLRPADIAVLVRDFHEANAVRRALLARGVASVYLSDRESVYSSPEARDLLHWLRAVAMPHDSLLIRAALATPTVGLSLATLAHLAANDAAFDQRSQQFHELNRVWREQGILAMLRRSLHLLELPARWLNQSDGERRLTNYLHLAELLQNAAAGLEGEAALIRWLATQIDAPSGDSEEQTVRLESDADLVKVVTIHKSKGLEYPVVCLPYACSFRPVEKRGRLFLELEGQNGQREIRLEFDEADITRADQDRLREDLRLFYVALTRARHAVWLGFAAVKRGNAKEAQNHRSAAGYLLAGPRPCSTEAMHKHLELLAQHIGTACRLEPAPQVVARTWLQTGHQTRPLLEGSPYQGRFERNWSLASFSLLVRGTGSISPGNLASTTEDSDDDDHGDAGPGLQDLPLLPTAIHRPAEDEDDERGLPIAPPRASTTAAEPRPWHHFPRGARIGDILHDQMEWLAGEHFQLHDNPTLISTLRKRMERVGLSDQADAALLWFQEIVHTRLPQLGTSLAKLRTVLPEMEFWLPADRLSSRLIDRLCRQHFLDGRERPELPPRQLHGMLMGFADLVFEHQGRYWVLDYKSNYLGPDASAYDTTGLQRAMAHHRYDVQALLYLLALHRLLQARLGAAYQPEEHLGGAVYFFMRGLDAAERGEYCIPVTSERLDALLSLEAQLGFDSATEQP